MFLKSKVLLKVLYVYASLWSVVNVFEETLKTSAKCLDFRPSRPILWNGRYYISASALPTKKAFLGNCHIQIHLSFKNFPTKTVMTTMHKSVSVWIALVSSKASDVTKNKILSLEKLTIFKLFQRQLNSTMQSQHSEIVTKIWCLITLLKQCVATLIFDTVQKFLEKEFTIAKSLLTTRNFIIAPTFENYLADLSTFF